MIFNISFTSDELDQRAHDQATASVLAMLMYRLSQEYPEEAQKFVLNWAEIKENTANEYLEASVKLIYDKYGEKYVTKKINKIAQELDKLL